MSPLDFDQSLLASGLVKIGVPLDYQSSLLAYLVLLSKWNKVYNLTAITEPREMVIKHIFDSLAINQYLVGSRFIDVGSGAGIPGIILAIVNPKQTWYLLDSSQKRTYFLAEVKSSLNLDNLRIIHSRVEAYKPDIDFNGVVTRAFASLAKTINICNHLSPYLYAMKATISKDDQTTLEQYKHSHFELMVPFLDQNRCLIKINQKADI